MKVKKFVEVKIDTFGYRYVLNGVVSLHTYPTRAKAFAEGILMLVRMEEKKKNK